VGNLGPFLHDHFLLEVAGQDEDGVVLPQVQAVEVLPELVVDIIDEPGVVEVGDLGGRSVQDGDILDLVLFSVLVEERHGAIVPLELAGLVQGDLEVLVEGFLREGSLLFGDVHHLLDLLVVLEDVLPDGELSQEFGAVFLPLLVLEEDVLARLALRVEVGEAIDETLQEGEPSEFQQGVDGGCRCDDLGLNFDFCSLLGLGFWANGSG
jgi:hypothetical protein